MQKILQITPKGPLPRLPLPPTVLQEQDTVHWCALCVAHWNIILEISILLIFWSCLPIASKYVKYLKSVKNESE